MFVCAFTDLLALNGIQHPCHDITDSISASYQAVEEDIFILFAFLNTSASDPFVCTSAALIPTICVHAHYEAVSHGFGLSQLVGVAVVHHVVAAETQTQMSFWGRRLQGSAVTRRGANTAKPVAPAGPFLPL